MKYTGIVKYVNNGKTGERSWANYKIKVEGHENLFTVFARPGKDDFDQNDQVSFFQTADGKYTFQDPSTQNGSKNGGTAAEKPLTVDWGVAVVAYVDIFDRLSAKLIGSEADIHAAARLIFERTFK